MKLHHLEGQCLQRAKCRYAQEKHVEVKGGSAALVDHTNSRRQGISWDQLAITTYASGWLAAWHMPVQ